MLADRKDEAIEALQVIGDLPSSRLRLLNRDTKVVTELDDLLAKGEEVLYPRQRRYASDKMWTNASGEQLMPGMRRIASTLPNARRT